MKTKKGNKTYPKVVGKINAGQVSTACGLQILNILDKSESGIFLPATVFLILLDLSGNTGLYL